MKKILLMSFLTAATVCANAGTPIAVDELPQTVQHTLEEYFPGASILSAEQERENGQMEYEVKIRYNSIALEVDLLEDGTIVDVDM